MERSDILLLVILIISLLSLWFSWKTSKKTSRRLLENYPGKSCTNNRDCASTELCCNKINQCVTKDNNYHINCPNGCIDNGDCVGWPNNICCPTTNQCVANDESYQTNCPGLSPLPTRRP